MNTFNYKNKNVDDTKNKMNTFNYKNKNVDDTKNKIIKLPSNFFVTSKYKNDIFENKIKEKHEYEQFFWTKTTVEKLLKACEYIYECCCFTTPSLCEGFRLNDRDEVLLDLDERFNYFPKFEKFDIVNPHIPNGSGNFNIIVIDPPFFNVSVQKLFNATNIITNNNYKTNIIIAFIVRYEYTLLEVFKPYGISETSAKIEYAHIKPNKWKNFKLYSNIDLPGIKRIPSKYGYKN
jgi:16S rRNA G966 N2-methylase RsmD